MSKKITKEAIQSFNRREEAGFKEIFYDMLHELHVYSSRVTGNWQESEDIVLKSFIDMWKSDAKFNTREALCAYLYKLVYRGSLNYVNSWTCRLKKKTQEISELDFPDKSDDDRFAENIAKLNEYLSCLPLRGQQVMHLHLMGFSPVEISERLGLAVSTVDNHKFRSVEKLREYFLKKQNTPKHEV